MNNIVPMPNRERERAVVAIRPGRSDCSLTVAARLNRGLRSAFTLIELLLVLVILAVLAAVVLPKLVGRSEQAREAAAKTDIANLETMIDAFEVDTGRFPTSEEGLGALVSAPSDVQNWRGPYIKRDIPKDPWGQPYIYKYPGTHNANGYDLYSTGPDMREGNDDITNWAQGQ